MLIALYNRNFDAEDIEVLQHIIHQLELYKVQLIFYKDFYERIKDRVKISNPPKYLFTDRHDLPVETDILLSLGGDGTLLDTVCFITNNNIPIIGINFGRLGFLSAISTDELSEAIQSLINGSYSIEKRSLIQLDSSIPLFNDTPFALNEFTIHRKDSSSMIKIHTYLNGEFLNSYWADGLIVATPTGSTGYSLSCGGPVVFPQANNFIITPVAPHNLNLRSIVVPDTSVISFEVEGRSDYFLSTLDSRSESITSEVQLAIHKANFTISLIRPHDHNFLKTIRQKLYWGIDKRN